MWFESAIRVGGSRVHAMRFPGGELNVRVPQQPPDVMIEACIKNAEDIITLLLVADAVRRAGARVLRLCIPYFPYARQDRVCNDGEALSVSVIASLINSADFAHVRTAT